MEDEEEHAQDSTDASSNRLLSDQLERYKKNLDPPSEDEDLEPLFIPLGWPKQLPQTYYKASDPEWQSFLAFNRDPKKAQQLQRMTSAPLQKIS